MKTIFTGGRIFTGKDGMTEAFIVQEGRFTAVGTTEDMLAQATPADTVYIGDSEVDIQTAQNAGLPCISVSWGFKDRAFLVENGAEQIASTVEELGLLI